MGRLLFPLIAMVSLLGCDVDLGDAPFRCNVGGTPQCPLGYECNAANVCVREGTCPAGVPGCPVCGNKNCEIGESCSACEQDCGKCQATCGNGVCETGETCVTCAQDCKECASVCGNGICETDETKELCSLDCKDATCTNEAPMCKDTETLQFCEDGKWVEYKCEVLCPQEGFKYSLGCEYSQEYKQYLCSCGNGGGFGEFCDDDQLCGKDLFCAAFSAGGEGFCTKYCTALDISCSDPPPGTLAECVLSVDSKKACGFICDGLATGCPSGMSCDIKAMLCRP
ncbi:MAG: hypothetical protein V1754_13355 [Pseudomonadota bacterium]